MMTIMSFPLIAVGKHTNNARQSLLLETAADIILSRFIFSLSKHLLLIPRIKEQCAACPLPEVPVVGMFMLFSDFGY